MNIFLSFQEATLRLAAVVTWAELEDALKEALQLVLPKVVSSLCILSLFRWVSARKT